MAPVTVVSATRLNQRDFNARSALGRSLAESYKSYPIRRKIFFENQRGLAACYNEAVRAAVAPEEILVFVHDDVLLTDLFWPERLGGGLELFDIVGLAGNRRRLPRQPGWMLIDEQLTPDASVHLSGAIGHGRQFPCQVARFGASGQECKLLDGVLLAAKKKTFDASGISFDERFDFHFYDLDFCRQAEQKGLRMGTIPLAVIHESGGAFGTPQWRHGYANYLDKWTE